VLDRLFSGWTFRNVVSQKLGNEIFGTLADTVPNFVLKIELSNLNGLHDLLISTTIKWRDSRQNNVSDYTSRPDVALLSVVSVQNFWCDVVGRSDLLAELLLWIKNLRSSEIDYLDLVKLLTGLQKYVFGLQVSMHNVMGVAVVNTGK